MVDILLGKLNFYQTAQFGRSFHLKTGKKCRVKNWECVNKEKKKKKKQWLYEDFAKKKIPLFYICLWKEDHDLDLYPKCD
ncbi:hypothetical protein CEXT_592591 [Caerostris extrusa]|uniref:Uncharacterized protein n=1 Tax=Caerostris extrusa TaxID=172846 RepID=A0AAV4U7V6_CAEEX|nr:hypothetical protein CEXT_592591 [Caerostris extrusa]